MVEAADKQIYHVVHHLLSELVFSIACKGTHDELDEGVVSSFRVCKLQS